ncbi:DUF3040 domain-containing protein [Corynebacterium heidelbergense]|uniref:DUF3040 domain-containing protein n=1 Tax=Corynebacterium heidelbergense TaxID=2055947 RepID=A0A364V9K7_9CORY|nr:DUF3040 domain-containing protein [Corynebacterium heidelbergense]RAV33342.1 hypothetical protein CWC39_09005 [Corynebacterium heidelbergense]WCZ36360.1 hypothetical protein CHEID_04045 [Corynebacterium heidelbergense]
MALSEKEQRMLAEIEQALAAEDPRFAQRAAKAGSHSGFSFNIRCVALLLLGLVTLIGGIALAQHSLWFVALSILGFLIMFAGGMLGFRGTQPSPKVGSAPQRGKSRPGRARVPNGNLGDRMENNFRKRFER